MVHSRACKRSIHHRVHFRFRLTDSCARALSLSSFISLSLRQRISLSDFQLRPLERLSVSDDSAQRERKMINIVSFHALLWRAESSMPSKARRLSRMTCCYATPMATCVRLHCITSSSARDQEHNMRKCFTHKHTFGRWFVVGCAACIIDLIQIQHAIGNWYQVEFNWCFRRPSLAGWCLKSDFFFFEKDLSSVLINVLSLPRISVNFLFITQFVTRFVSCLPRYREW